MEGTSLNKIKFFLDDLMGDIEQYAFKQVTIPTNKSDVWTDSNKAAINSKNIIIEESDESVTLKVTASKQMYIAYNEERINFKSIPSENFEILPGKKYRIVFNGDISGSLSARLYFIGYDKNDKSQQEIVDINKEKEIEVKENSKYFRFAIRLLGEGIVTIKSIRLVPIKDELVSKEIEYMPTESTYNVKNNIKKVEDVNIACILDEFSYESFSKECNMIPVTPYNFFATLENNRPDFLLVESAWKGYKGSWEFKIAKYNNQDKTQLFQLLNYCKAKNIPTVFWNKEDPIHFDKFIDTAKLFDVIFTTDRNKIDDYISVVEHKRVYSLPFAAQVKTHNPIKKYKREKGICFAGSYYGNRHKERKEDMDNVLGACKSFNLSIYDRNYKATLENKNSPFRYPEEFVENVKGELSYLEIDKAYKGFEVMLNVNSVKHSPTMFSRRVYEGLASGTPIVSTYSKGVNDMFGDIVISDDDKDKLVKKIKVLMENKTYWKKLSLKGIRKVMFNHTYENRIRYMLSKLEINIERPSRTVSMISFVNNIQEIEKSINEFNKQKYEDKELILIVDKLFDGYTKLINEYNQKNIKLFIGEFVRTNYKSIKTLISGEYLCIINKNNLYGENYLIDLIAASMYTDADIIGKRSYYYKDKNKGNKKLLKIKDIDQEYTFVNSLKVDRSIIKVSSLSNIPLLDLFKKSEKDGELSEYFKLGFKMFSADNNNFVEGIDKVKLSEEEIEKIFL